MTEKKINELQKKYGYDHWQDMISKGTIWGMEGTAGRTAMELLEMGVCYLPKMSHEDYWHNRVPSRNDLQDGTKGTMGNATKFWLTVLDGSFKLGKDEYFAWM